MKKPLLCVWSTANYEIGREIPEEVADKTDHDNEFPLDMWKKLGEAGYYTRLLVFMGHWLITSSFLGITAAEDYGGLAMGYQAHCIVMEEISRASGLPCLYHTDHTKI